MTKQATDGLDKPVTDRTRFRGFASLDDHRKYQIAQMGGKKAHELGKAHKFTKEEARAAGLKSAAARKAKKEATQGG